MKKKRFLATCLSTFMTISSVVTPFLSIPVSAAGNLNSFTENGTSDIPISCEVSSGYTVSLPASIALNSDTSKSGYNVGQIYKVGVSGNIASDNFVIVTPKDIDNFALQDVTGSRIVNPVINQTDVSWSSDELGTGSEIVEKDGDIYAQIDLAGSYSGEANFEFYLSDKDVDNVGSKEESRLQLSFENLENSVKSNGDTIMLGTGEDLNIGVSATLDGKDVSTDAITYTTTNNNIYIDDSGDLVVTKNAKPGESATITATVDESTVSTAKADPITFALTKTGIIDSVFAANNVSVSFNVTLVDINFDRIQLVDVDTIAMHPNDRITLKANITPSSALSDLKWHKTDYTVGLNINKVTKDATIITRDMEFGDTFTIIASVGDFAKTLNVVIDHMYTDEDGFIEITDATCTTDGSIVHICRKCGEEKIDVIPTLGHKSVSSNNAIAATCTTAGKESDTKCSVCGVTLTTGKTIPAAGHVYGLVTYNWSDDKSTCTASRTCSTCSHVDTETVNTTNEVTTAATCTKAGVRTYTATFTNSAFKTQTTTVAVSAAGHKSISANNAITATCTTVGKESDTKCSVCGATLTTGKTIPATGHSYGEYSVTKAATCTEDGSKARTCSVCNHVDTAVITKLGHDYASTFTVDKAATCTEDGSKSKHCSRCDSKSEITSIPATGHSYGEYTVTKAATCTEDGSKERTCSVCDNVDTAVITKLGHDYVSTFTVDKAATCTETGSKSKHCSRCDSKSEITSIPATGHSYGSVVYNWSDDKSTCTASRTCSTCSHVDTETVNTTNEVTTAATCTEAGVRTYTATFTNSEFKTQTATVAVSATGHNYENGKCTTCFALGAGLYDANDNLLCTWEKSGINVETNYTSSTYKTSTTSPYYVLTNNYSTVTKIVIPDSVTSIGDGAFYYCSKLTNITIPNSVTSIGSNAFCGCSNLTDITIPDSVTSIADGALSNCYNLTDINVDANNTVYCSVDGVVFNKNITTIIACPRKRTSYIIPDSVTSIGNSAFNTCTNLTSITIPNSVTSIGNYAFYGCSGLISITIPNSVTSIGNGAFGYCRSLTSIIIPDSVTSIENNTFFYCSGLTSITIPNSVTSIGWAAFDRCSSLTSATIGTGVTSIEFGIFDNCSKLTSVTFKTTSGWYVGSSTGAKTTALSSSDLANPSTAATYLKTTYRSKYWTR